jgi:hypothetical protein
MTKILPILFFLLLSQVFSAQAQMEFVENKGQWDQRVLFKGEFNTGSFFLESQGFTVLMHHPDDLNTLSEKTHGHGAGGSLHTIIILSEIIPVNGLPIVSCIRLLLTKMYIPESTYAITVKAMR